MSTVCEPFEHRHEADLMLDDHTARYERISQDMVELSMQADVERRASEERAAQVEAEFEDGLRKITGAMEHLERSFASGDTFGQGA